jgi:hypothetical protein
MLNAMGQFGRSYRCLRCAPLAAANLADWRALVMRKAPVPRLHDPASIADQIFRLHAAGGVGRRTVKHGQRHHSVLVVYGASGTAQNR